MMINYSILLLLLLFQFQCSTVSSTNHRDSIRGIRLTRTAPGWDYSKKIFTTRNDTVLIYQQHDLTLYSLQYIYDSVFNNQLLKSEIRYHYFVHHKDSLYGYDFDRHKADYPKRKMADSVFNEWVNGFKIENIIKNDTLIVKGMNKNDSARTLNKVYTVISKENSSTTGSLNLHYTSGIVGAHFSISNRLDTLKNMKLTQAHLKSTSERLNELGVNTDKFATIIKLEDFLVLNRKDVEFIFKEGSALYFNK